MQGRIKIYTDVPEITKENVIEVLEAVLPLHTQNSEQIKHLLSYEEGEQKIVRVKQVRADINCQCIDNVANEVAEFKEGFHWGNPITLVQNGNSEDSKTEAIGELNKQYVNDNHTAKLQEIGRYAEITGVACEYIDLNDEWQEEGDPFFTTIPLDPRLSFIVYSSYYADRRKMMGVTFRVDSEGNRHFTCITKRNRFEIVDEKIKKGRKETREMRHKERSGEANPFGIINMVEWVRYCDRMGCFERQISEMDNLNLMISDFSNDVEQNTQAIWHTNDVNFPVDEAGNEISPKTNEWIMTYTSENGKQPFIKALAIQYDYRGMLDNIISRRSLILQKCKIPQRNDNSGGSTGIAMSDATGWSEAEMVASKQQPFQELAKKEEVKIVLAVIKKSRHIKADNPLLQLRASDVKPNIKRQKTYEMTTKVNALATMITHGISAKAAINTINLFEDPNLVYEESKELIEEYQKSLVKKETQPEGGEGEKEPDAERISQDPSDQIENSPMIDSTRVDTTN